MFEHVMQFGLFAVLAVALPSGLARVESLNSVMPKVVVWMLLGIAIGTMAPGLFEETALWPITTIGFIGLQAFGLRTGTHLEIEELRHQGARILTLGFTSFLVPAIGGYFVSGTFLALYSDVFEGYNPQVIRIICGVFAGVTALPVLSAILSLMGLSKTKLGRTNLSMATLHDFILWPVVGVITVSAGAHGSHESANLWQTIGWIGFYLFVMFVPLRWFLIKLGKGLNFPLMFVAVIGVTTVSSIVTHELGLHYLLGAVVAGAMLPHDYKKSTDWIEKPTLHLLLPFFVVSAGLGISLGSLSVATWIMLIALCAANLVGQFGGSYSVARVLGYGKQEAMAITSFMTCKGIVELALAKLLYTAHVIPLELYIAAVLMAITLTAITAPWAQFALRGLPELRLRTPQFSPAMALVENEKNMH